MTSKLVSLLAAVCLSVPALAQPQLELPRLSPNGKVTQTVGLTEISVEYSSPAVKGRPIWGSLVPYGELWRAGANAPTKVTFSKDVTVGTTTVPAGSYSLFMIPTAATWTIILNKDLEANTSAYKKELDVARAEVKPESIPMRERLVYLVSDFTNEAASLSLEWEKIRVALPIKLGTEAQVAQNLKQYEEGAWMPFNAAARYQLEQKKDFDAGLALVDKSLRIKEDWFNNWTKAQLLAAKGNYKAAYPFAQKAQQLGEKSPRFFFAKDVKKALEEWKNKK